MTQTDINKMKEYLPQVGLEEIRQLQKLGDIAIQRNNAESLFSNQFALNIGKLYFADSVIGLECISKEKKIESTIYDLGGGNGFPGIVLAIMFPAAKVVFIEKDKKKSEFVADVIKELSLQNASVSTLHLERAPEESIFFAVSRGNQTIYNSLIAAGNSIKRGGTIYHFKADNWPSEVAMCPTQVFSKWEIEAVGSYTLPDSSINRSIVKTVRKQ